MDPILYNAAGGGRIGFKRQEIIANNLANLSTPGFKADMYQAQTMYASTDGSGKGPSFPIQNQSAVNLSPGEIMTTGRNLDIAIEGNGWFAVGSQGKEAYTKAGNLRLDINGLLTTASGLPVLGNGGPISIPPAQSVNIGTDGTITVVPLGGDPKSAAILDRIKLVTLDKNNIVKNSEGLFQLKNGGTPAAADGSVKIRSGAIEGSNVNAIDQMVEMITSGREYDAHMKVISTVEDNFQKLAQVLQE
ncbi:MULTISPECIES: flagellar basal-body rod protein FlgF [Legionella]|uniref:Flagellar basal-body rod protein FlgF n=1 Tax=Legionella resiliens TaxID=2905958 RepID=A0ABS8X5H3_9GAMM|nr:MULTISPECIES: flagellar basal-body rod protein FlgF [unclassified Legionella]MCE0724056.1 flagellar basal-body rod protein FlgF [Legionella sp. 9fVS26]MCE3533209.1 flagellar basal-body rod protein FlgF [Legionella sp. 8cVS16]QLZ69389.1 flagellar basal-body rod protein FlgF [Legionella sp. PC1000]